MWLKDSNSTGSGGLFTDNITGCKLTNKNKPAPNTQEHHLVGTEEVQSHKIELEENVTYGPVEQSHMIELKENVAYGPVK